MDFNLSAEHEQVRDLVRRFCHEEIAPLVTQGGPNGQNLSQLGTRRPIP